MSRDAVLGSINPDDLYVRVFTVDEVRISEPEYWAESYHILDEVMWLKASENYYVVLFENSEFSKQPQIGDYLMLRALDQENDYKIIKAWFKVTSVMFDDDDNPYRYILRYEAGDRSNTRLNPGSVFINFGRPSGDIPFIDLGSEK